MGCGLPAGFPVAVVDPAFRSFRDRVNFRLAVIAPSSPWAGAGVLRCMQVHYGFVRRGWPLPPASRAPRIFQ